MSRKLQFGTGEIYHIFNRGVEKRDIYMDNSDCFRFIYSLYECNDRNAVVMRDRIGERLKRKNVIGPTYGNSKSRELLVEVLAFTLMPNHYHLVVRQLVDNGISLFMKKLGNAYVGYFNEKHNRKGMGSLFQGKFRAVHVKTDRQFIYLVWYVFTNPLDLLEKNWREEGVKDTQKAIDYLESYKWSSYLDCIGIKNFPSVTSRDFLIDSFNGEKGVKDFIEERISEGGEMQNRLNKIKSLILE